MLDRTQLLSLQVDIDGYLARRLGFGVSGPHATFLIPPSTTAALVQRAYKLGVRYFDTAPSYGAGEAERRLGLALAHLPSQQLIVSTKVGILSAGLTSKHRDFSPEGIRLSLAASLKRLRRSRVEVLFLHGPSPSEMTDELLKILLELTATGDVGAIGVCGIGLELDAAMSTGLFTHYMTPVHAGLTPEAAARVARLRAAGQLIGIDTMAMIKKKTLSVSAGAAWRLARAVTGRGGTPLATPLRPDDAISWALAAGGAHSIVTTTSRRDHLVANVEAVKAVFVGEHEKLRN